jgi:chitosanase
VSPAARRRAVGYTVAGLALAGGVLSGVLPAHDPGPGPAQVPVPVPPTTAPAGPTPEMGMSSERRTPRSLDRDLAMRLVASAENSTLDWQAQYGYLTDLGDGRGYTGGIVGFCSGTDDMLRVVLAYTRTRPGNPLAGYVPALRKVNGTDSHDGLDPGFPAAWRAAAHDPAFQRAQRDEVDRAYLRPAVRRAQQDGLRVLGQFAYFDAAVMHGVDVLDEIRRAARDRAQPPAAGGAETDYLEAFLDARVARMRAEDGHGDTSRVDTEQRVFLRAANLDLLPPLTWRVYGDTYTITRPARPPATAPGAR